MEIGSSRLAVRMLAVFLVAFGRGCCCSGGRKSDNCKSTRGRGRDCHGRVGSGRRCLLVVMLVVFLLMLLLMLLLMMFFAKEPTLEPLAPGTFVMMILMLFVIIGRDNFSAHGFFIAAIIEVIGWGRCGSGTRVSVSGCGSRFSSSLMMLMVLMMLVVLVVTVGVEDEIPINGTRRRGNGNIRNSYFMTMIRATCKGSLEKDERKEAERRESGHYFDFF